MLKIYIFVYLDVVMCPLFLIQPSLSFHVYCLPLFPVCLSRHRFQILLQCVCVSIPSLCF